MTAEFTPSTSIDEASSAPPHWILLRGTEILVGGEPDGERVLPTEVEIGRFIESLDQHPLGVLNGRNVIAAEAPADFEPLESFVFAGIRELFENIDLVAWALAGRAIGIIEWDRTHRFCGRCGTATERQETQRSRSCPRCGLVRFPRLDPSIIVAVEKDGQLLLARNATYPANSFSVLAGFVDQGETLEDAVRREVCEEVGIEVESIAYFGSQFWPFPHGLMVAFTALWKSGELQPDSGEISEANWFPPDALPPLPGKISIARALVDDFVRRQRGE